MIRQEKYQVVDLFAGPGGLGEGFSSYVRGDAAGPAFENVVSVEKDEAAHRTLRFRAFMRRARRQGVVLDWEGFDPSARNAEDAFLERQSEEACALWREASEEAVRAELGGSRDSRERIDAALKRLNPATDTVLVGGPPCQAYSVVGRARNRGIRGYRPEKDQRHYLYQEYVDILERIQPTAFIMENVKGILSARVRKQHVFQQIIADFEASGYAVFPMAPAENGSELFDAPDAFDFVIRSERFGIPQARHRVIVLGLRKDVVGRLQKHGNPLRRRIAETFHTDAPPVPLEQVLAGLPKRPSSLSRRAAEGDTWLDALHREGRRIGKAVEAFDQLSDDHAEQLLQHMDAALEQASDLTRNPGCEFEAQRALNGELGSWLLTNPTFGVMNHEPRSHMPADLGRYMYAACYAAVRNTSPRAPDFPDELAPRHANWKSGKFADRFRVQVAHEPATTVTSHISKDGHYFIHPDPAQCRSLTVREAARIQTFPDDYIFFGSRTQQYVQVGNAVPPYLARRIAATLDSILSAGRSAED